MSLGCAICLENIEQNELFLHLICDHSFHYYCLSKVRSSLCPLCRKDNNNLLIDNGIDIDDNRSDASSYDSYYSSSDYLEQTDHAFACRKKIDELVEGKDYDPVFISIIKTFDITFDQEMVDRAYELNNALKKYKLEIRNDSSICMDYILDARDDMRLNKIVDSMIETHWFFSYTDYVELIHTGNGRYFAKDRIIKRYVMNPEEFKATPPQTREIRKLIAKHELNFRVKKEIEKWNGNLTVNLYSLIRKEDIDFENGNLIENFVMKYAETYAKNNFKLFMKENIENKIANLLQNEISIYPMLKQKAIWNICREIRQNLKEYCAKLDYRNNGDWYLDYNEYCRKQIDNYVGNEIGKKYPKSKVMKFTRIEEEEWNSHIKGCDVFRNCVHVHIYCIIDENIAQYVKKHNLFYKSDIKNLKLTEFMRKKLEEYLEDHIIINADYCIERIFRHQLEKTRDMTIEKRLDFYIKENKFESSDLQTVTLKIFDWFLRNSVDCVENNNHVTYLQKLDFGQLDKSFIAKLRTRPFFCNALPNKLIISSQNTKN